VRLPNWLRRRVSRFDRRWMADQAERDRYDAMVAARLTDRAAKPSPVDQGFQPQAETTSLVVRDPDLKG
jgi:hypothetical protein